MKKLIIAVSIVLWFSVAFGDRPQQVGEIDGVPLYSFKEVKIPESSMNNEDVVTLYGYFNMYVYKPSQITNKQEVIQYFIDSGDVCEVIGHDWITYDPCAFYEDGITYTFSGDNCHGLKTRTCQICGLKQKELFRYKKVETEIEIKEWINVK